MTRPPLGRLLCIDHGIKRIGLAVCDGSQLIARELSVLVRKSKQEDFDAINRVAAQQTVVAVVIGIPYNESDQPGVHSQADTVRLWAERYGATTPLPLFFWDEQLTSEDAKDLARQQRRKPDAPVDDLAARVILQSYIDALRAGLAGQDEQQNEQDKLT
ncbi:MAG: Holliday junction resolvase RuvX [Armatimonadetes bacterium]|nr:Holliday junction resolvase RuvX [Anaerolineae bacterium]